MNHQVTDGYYDSYISEVYASRNVNGKPYFGVKNSLSLNHKPIRTIVDFYYLNEDALSYSIARINDLLEMMGEQTLDESKQTYEYLFYALRGICKKKAIVKITSEDVYKKIQYIKFK